MTDILAPPLNFPFFSSCNHELLSIQNSRTHATGSQPWSHLRKRRVFGPFFLEIAILDPMFCHYCECFLKSMRKNAAVRRNALLRVSACEDFQT